MSAEAGSAPQPISVFTVELTDNRGDWRPIAVPGSQRLDDLHTAIYEAFDRDDE